MQQKQKKVRKISSRRLSKDLITNTIFKQLQAEVLEKYGEEISEEQVRQIASVPYQKLFDYLHNLPVEEGKGVRILNIGSFFVKRGRLDVEERMKQVREEGYTGLEASRIGKLRYMDELLKKKEEDGQQE